MSFCAFGHFRPDQNYVVELIYRVYPIDHSYNIVGQPDQAKNDLVADAHKPTNFQKPNFLWTIVIAQ